MRSHHHKGDGNARETSMKARTSICVAAIGVATGLACAGIGDPVLCFEQM